MSDRPTITVDLEMLDSLLTEAEFPGYPTKSHSELSAQVAERKRELNAPAPGPWRWATDGRGHPCVVDADNNGLDLADTKRAAMAPGLADWVREVVGWLEAAKKAPIHYASGTDLLARFDNPDEPGAAFTEDGCPEIERCALCGSGAMVTNHSVDGRDVSVRCRRSEHTHPKCEAEVFRLTNSPAADVIREWNRHQQQLREGAE